MNVQTITSTPTVPPTGNAVDWLSANDLLQKLGWLIGIIVFLVAAAVVYIIRRKEMLKRAHPNASVSEMKRFVRPSLFAYDKIDDVDNKETLSYRKVVHCIAEKEYPLKDDTTGSPLFFIFANPACGKTKFSKNLRTRVMLKYFCRKHFLWLLHNKIGGSPSPERHVELVLCRDYNQKVDSFEALKDKISSHTDTVLIFDGFDELCPPKSANVAIEKVYLWREKKLFEIIDMLSINDKNNAIVITYRTTDNTELNKDISNKPFRDRKISRLEIYEYNKDYVGDSAAIKYAKRVFKVNNRVSKYKFDGKKSKGLTVWQKRKTKKIIRMLYKIKDAEGDRTGRFIALPLYSAYAYILLDILKEKNAKKKKDIKRVLSELSDTSYLTQMVNIMIERELDKLEKCNGITATKEESKKTMTENLIALAAYFTDNNLFEISASDPKIREFGSYFPSFFLQAKGDGDDKKYEFQHEKYIEYFNGLTKSTKSGIYTVEDSLAKGNHLRFESSPEIKWRILDYKNRENKVLLISDQILSLRAFNTTEHEDKPLNDWETSDIKAYLNGDFLEKNFSDAERAKIHGEDENKIFLLSVDEANTYFSSKEDRIAYCCETAYNDLKAKADKEASYAKDYINGLQSAEQGAWWWWLRSPGYNSDIAALVDTDGDLYIDGNDTFSESGGVRPALWLNL